MEEINATEIKTIELLYASGGIETLYASDIPKAHKPLDTSKAPQLPTFFDLAPTTFKTDMTLPNIYTWLYFAFNSLSVDFKQSEEQYCGLKCTMFILQTLVEFEVSFFRIDTEHMVEIRRMSGYRDAFFEAMLLISTKLQVSYIGANYSLPMRPLPLPDLPDLPELYSPDKNLLELTKNLDKHFSQIFSFDHLSQLISDDLRVNLQVEGLRAITTIFKSLDPKEMYDKIVIDMTFRIIELIHGRHRDFYALNILIMCMFSIAILAEKLDTTLTPKWFDKAVPVVVAHIKNENLHVRREALRAVLNFILKGKPIIDQIIDVEFIANIRFEAQGRDGGVCQDFEAIELAKKIIQVIESQ